MPETAVFFYKDGDGTVPVRSWLEQLRKKDSEWRRFNGVLFSVMSSARPTAIRRALERKNRYELNPEKHTHEEIVA